MKTFVAIIALGASVFLVVESARQNMAGSLSSRLAGTRFESFCNRHGDELIRALDCDIGGNGIEFGVTKTLTMAKR